VGEDVCHPGEMRGSTCRLLVAMMTTVSWASLCSFSDSAASGVPVRPNVGLLIPGCGCAGYNWEGRVTEISADWHVPTIRPDSPDGQAATWVGAQNPSGPPFIQLGTLEGEQDGEVSYVVFWSDATLHYVPQIIGIVHGGDLVDAQMIRDTRGWTLHFEDRSRSLVRHLSTPYGSRSNLMQAEWMQEDPTMQPQLTTEFPYPTTSVPSMQRIQVNGKVPRLTDEDAVTFASPNGIDLVPSAYHHGEFELRPATGAALQFLTDTAGFDKSAFSFVQVLVGGRKKTLVDNTAAKAYLVAVQWYDLQLLDQTWPATTEPDIQTLVKEDQRFADAIQSWEFAGFVKLGPTVSMLARVGSSRRTADDRVRRDMGLPPAT